MQLPIDARNAPFKAKYIDEETPMFARWMAFGGYAGMPGLTLVCSGDTDVVEYITLSKAKRLVAARDRFVDEVLEILNG